MKRFRFAFVLVVTVLSVTACDWLKPIIPVKNKYSYFLHISFTDREGNEFAAPLAAEVYKTDASSAWRGEINPEKYTLDLTLSKAEVVAESISASLTMSKFSEQYVMETPNADGTYGPDGKWYLNFRGFVMDSGVTHHEYLKYKFTCPVIFGDDSVHEIICYWTAGIQGSNYEFYPACTKVVIDGKELKPEKGITFNSETNSSYIGYFVDVVLDRADN